MTSSCETERVRDPICPKCRADAGLSAGEEMLKRADLGADRWPYAAGVYAASLLEIRGCELALCDAHKAAPEQEIAKLQTVLDAMTAAGLLRKS